ncbi:MAG TPA: CBS domain-containing protein [Candidatus Binatia bacterium]|nr:CBS domain-containing protein [Candidatus Binatia bacterium]
MQEIGSALARQAETAGERLTSLANAFREALPTDGAAALFSEALGERDMRELGQELGNTIRRYPLQAMLVGAGFGFLVSRMTTRRSTGSATASGKRVRDVMTRHVEVIRPDASLKEAAAKMADLDVGTLPACDGERLVGMVTDRDITIRGVARGLDPASTPVREIMSTTIRYAYEDEPIEQAVETMKKRNIRRLPVLDREKRLAGIVALGDLAVEGKDEAGDVLQDVSAARPTH